MSRGSLVSSVYLYFFFKIFQLFPLNTVPTADSTDAFLISFNPSSQYYGLLSRNSITIYNNLDSLFPRVFKFTRDSSSLKTYVPNHWFQWITDTSFAFGTFTGNIFFFNSLSQKEPILYSIESIITSTFSAYGFLGVCVKGPIIYFFNETKFYSKIEIDLPFPFIKNSKFYSNSILSITLNNQPFICHLSNVMIQSKWKIPFKKLTIENSTNFSFNPNSSKIAYSTQDGSVYLWSLYNQSFNLNYDSNRPSKLNENQVQIFESGSEVVHLFWLNDYTQLCAIKRGGELFLWSTEDNSSFKTKISDLIDVDSLEFDDLTKTLLCINGKFLINIEFCVLSPPLCMTSMSLFHISTGKMIASVHQNSNTQFNDILALPPQIFPIKMAVESMDSDLAIYGGNCLVTITENKLFLKPLSDLTAMAWCNRKLYVFCTSNLKSKRSSSTLTVFSNELVNVGSISSPHLASSVSASPNNNRIVITNNHFLTVFDFDANKPIKKPPTSKFMESHIGWEDFAVSITTFTVPEAIITAICGFNDDVWLHLRTRTSAGRCSTPFNFEFTRTINNSECCPQKVEDHVNSKLDGKRDELNDSDDESDKFDFENIVVSFPSYNVIDIDVDKIWRQPKLDLIFVKKSSTVSIYTSFQSSLYSFEISNTDRSGENKGLQIYQKSDKPLCSMGPDFIFLRQDFVFGLFPFTTLDFAFHAMKEELAKSPFRCFVFSSSLKNLDEFGALMSHLCVLGLQQGLVLEYVDFMKHFKSNEIIEILSKFDKSTLAVLTTTFSVDDENFIEISRLFGSFDTDLQIQILTTSSPSEFLKIIHNNEYKKVFLKSDNVTFLSKVIDSLIMSMEWSKLERFCHILLNEKVDIDLPSKLNSFNELSKLPFGQTLRIIEKDDLKWSSDQNQKDLLKNLGFAFTAADLGQWAAACFGVSGDESKCKFILLDKPEIINDVDKFVKDKENIEQEQMICFLKKIIDGILNDI